MLWLCLGGEQEIGGDEEPWGLGATKSPGLQNVGLGIVGASRASQWSIGVQHTDQGQRSNQIQGECHDSHHRHLGSNFHQGVSAS